MQHADKLFKAEHGIITMLTLMVTANYYKEKNSTPQSITQVKVDILHYAQHIHE